MPAVACRLTLALGAAAVLWLLLAVPAGARVVAVPTGSGSEEVSVGLLPRDSEFAFDGASVGSFDNAEGNSVLHKNGTYAIYWDPTDHYHGDWQHLINTFFQGLGAESGSSGNVFAVDSQYTDRSNRPASYISTFRGAYTDTDPYPTPRTASTPSARRIDGIPQREKRHTPSVPHRPRSAKSSKHFIPSTASRRAWARSSTCSPPRRHRLPGRGEPTAPGHCSDSVEGSAESYENSFCSYHSDISPTNPVTGDGNTVLYGVIPWTAGRSPTTISPPKP